MKLTLLVRAYCHLCDEMHGDLVPMLASSGATVDVIDVDAHPALAARWGDKVPVLLADEQEICHYRLDAGAVVRWLAPTTDAASR